MSLQSRQLLLLDTLLFAYLIDDLFLCVPSLGHLDLIRVLHLDHENVGVGEFGQSQLQLELLLEGQGWVQLETAQLLVHNLARRHKFAVLVSLRTLH